MLVFTTSGWHLISLLVSFPEGSFPPALPFVRSAFAG